MSGQFTISKVWGERFHRRSSKLESPTKDWIFYISRPTLEAARKPDREGITVDLLKTTVEDFLNSESESTDFNESFTIRTECKGRNVNKKGESRYTTICYPFNINDEIDNKKGVLIHIGLSTNVDGYAEMKDFPTFDSIDGYPKMFNPDHKELISEYLLEKNGNRGPPGVEQSDPMWMEFSSSKILPTDELLRTDYTHGKFRSVISHQYIEVRLVRSRILGGNNHHYNREQLDAISAYESLNSGFSNFAGPPGTGKSTILHMVCAHHIFQNYISSEADDEKKKKRIMYYVPSPMLKEEAKREIKSILINIYEPIIKNFDETMPTDLLTDLSYIEFVSQEDLFIITSHTKLDPQYNILRESSKEQLIHELNYRDKRKQDDNLKLIKKGLRTIHFGLLGGERPRNYVELAKKGKSIDLFSPLNTDNNLARNSVNHQLGLPQFIASGKSREEDQKDLDQIKRDIDKLHNSNKLYNGADEQFWDPAAVVQKSFNVKHSKGTLWAELKHQIDYIVIDEVQDISITEIRILLEHFASRREDEPLRPFRLVCAGDENQNVKHLLFTEQNQHVRFLYNDWILHLKNSGGKTSEGFKLSHNLSTLSEKNLVSGYRVFNEMIDYVNAVISLLRDNHTNQTRKLSISELKLTPFGRSGVCITLEKDNHAETELWLESVYEQLKTQLGVDDEGTLRVDSEPIRVAMTYDKEDFDMGFEKNPETKNPFSKRLMNKNGQYINTFAERLDKLFTSYTNAFLKQEKYNLSELRDSLLLKGVMDESSIKGLTMPITIVLPPKSLVGNRKLNDEELSKYLVQITRAQYMNIILENLRIQEFKDFDGILKSRGEDEIPDIAKWLEDILKNSAGFDYSFSNLFERTLEDYTSKPLWLRLKEEASGLEDELKTYVLWLEQLFENIIGERGKKLTNLEFDEEFLTNDDKFICVDGKVAEITEIIDLSGYYLLGKYMNHLPALRLFLTINTFMRPKFSSNISEDDMKENFERWIYSMIQQVAKGNQNEELSDVTLDDYDDQMTMWWLKMICERQHDSDNQVCIDLHATFNDFKWPQTPLPRLRMGPWRIKQTKQSDGAEKEVNSKNQTEFLKTIRDEIGAWMDEGSQFFNIHPYVLNKALVDTIEKSESQYSAKSKLFLGLVSQKVDIFCEGMSEVLSTDDDGLRKELLDWFVEMFIKYQKPEHDFKSRVNSRLEDIIQDNEAIKNNLTTYFASADEIRKFENIIIAFGFEEWDRCVNVAKLFESAINLTYRSIEYLNKENETSNEIIRLASKINQLERRKKEKEDEFWLKVSATPPLLTRLAEYHTTKIIVGDEVYENQYWLETNGFDDLDKFGEQYYKDNVFKEYLPHADLLEIIELIRDISNEEAKLKELEKINDDIEKAKLELDQGHNKDNKLNHSESPNLMANPFRRNGPIFKFFNPLFSKMKNNSQPNIHKQWFDVLWGIENLLDSSKAFIGNNDFERHPLRFPPFSKNPKEMGYKVNACVNSFTNVSQSKLDYLTDLIEEALFPYIDGQGNIIEHTWITDLMLMLESLHTQYKDTPLAFQNYRCFHEWVCDKPKCKTINFSHYDKCKGCDSHRNKKSIYERLYLKLLETCRKRLPKKLIACALNKDKSELDLIMNNQMLSQYLSTPQALFVYASLCNKFLEPHNAIDSWKRIEGFITVKKDEFEEAKENRKRFPFMDNLIEKSRQNERIYRQKRRVNEDYNFQPVLHKSFFDLGAKRKDDGLHDNFVNAATLRGLGQLCSKNLERAALDFANAGLLYHSGALKLHHAFTGEKKIIKDFLDLIAQILKLEKTTLNYTMYQSPGIPRNSINNTIYDSNRRYTYGIGPDNDNWSWERSLLIKFKMNQKKSPMSMDAQSKTVEFFKHFDLVEQYETLRNMMDEVLEHTHDQAQYGYSWDVLQNKNQSKFRNNSFFDSKREAAKPTYHWEWRDDKKNPTKKAGLIPVSNFSGAWKASFHDDRRIQEMLNHFIQMFLEVSKNDDSFYLKDVMSLEDWRKHLQKFTGIDGAILGLINPDSCHLPDMDDESPVDVERQKIDHWFDQFKTNNPQLLNNRKIKHQFKHIFRGLNEENYSDALEEVELSDLLSDDRKKLTKLIEGLFKEAKPKEFRKYKENL